ncbi:MAG: GFA family protein [Pseudomonadota bacterium]
MQGRCLCGGVSITAPRHRGFEVCHCGMCRRWGGGPMMAVHCGRDVEIANRDGVRTFDSSEWAERAFCATCGTHLYYRLKPADEYVVPVGLFQDDGPFELREQIFIDRKPEDYAFSADTPLLTEADVFERYGAG